MIYGYARVSTTGQNLATQLDKLKAAGCEQIIEEKVIGVATKKERLDSLLNDLQGGDTLIVTRMDRLGRDTIQLLSLVEELEQRNVFLVILDINIDTRTPTGKFFLTIMSGFAELDRTMIKEKTAAGIALAKKQGKYKGRPTKFTDKNPALLHALDLYANTSKTVKEICSISSVGRTTLYDAIKERNIVRGGNAK
ncbi:recombinase family protein [Sporosarcina aquimarina]|uniref:Recombinase family protein n=1 Tax=Sporosarcina aquimarina TaxID=114975 RepID=A0ABU4G0G2_9BACL|nr:recombinase family protein [Sporosarcina aquimarina]MDW0110458.1 recombinase family protein [Sporosarcina aquimarina]